MTRVLALGTFDLLHAGHMEFLRQAREHGDELVVAVNTDEFAARFKRPPILGLDHRLAALKGCVHVDEVWVNDGGEDSRPVIEATGARIIVHGDDWTGDSYMRQLGVNRPWLESHGVEIRYVPYTQGISTSEIIERCQQQAWKQIAPDIDGRCCAACGTFSSNADIARRAAA